MNRMVGVVLTLVWFGGVRVARAQDAVAADTVAADTVAAEAAPEEAAPAKSVVVGGYATASYTYSAHPVGDGIAGRLYDRVHDQFMLNAADVVVEVPVATDKVDAGGRIEALFGQNAELTKSAGLSVGDDGDILQAFVTLNLPTGEGTYLQFKAGKIATLMGLEVLQDVVNPNLSVANQFVLLENFTNTGVRVDAKLSPSLDAQLAVFNGWDVVRDANTKKSFMGRLGLAPDDQTVIGLLGFVGAEQPDNGDNLRYGGEALLTRKFGAATFVAQFDYGEEEAATTMGDKATWWGAGAWLTLDLTPTVGLALRGDYINDEDGARSTAFFTGSQLDLEHQFGSATATLNLKTWNKVLVRPEIRYDRSNQAVYDGEKDQFTFALGVSYLY